MLGLAVLIAVLLSCPAAGEIRILDRAGLGDVHLLAAPTRTPTPTRAPTPRTPKPTNIPTDYPTEQPTFYPTQQPTYQPTNAPQQPAPPPAPAAVDQGQVLGIVLGVWAAFCVCTGVGYWYYKRLQKKIAESEAYAGDFVVTSGDSGYEDEAGVTKYVEQDEGVVNPLQMAGTTGVEMGGASVGVGDDDEEFLADEDLL